MSDYRYFASFIGQMCKSGQISRDTADKILDEIPVTLGPSGFGAMLRVHDEMHSQFIIAMGTTITE